MKKIFFGFNINPILILFFVCLLFFSTEAANASVVKINDGLRTATGKKHPKCPKGTFTGNKTKYKKQKTKKWH